MTKTPTKDYLVSLKKIVSVMIKKGNFQEACLLGRFIENKDSIALRTLSKKFNRIFCEQDIKDMVKAVREVTNRYVPKYAQCSNGQGAGLSAKRNRKIIPLRNPSRNRCE